MRVAILIAYFALVGNRAFAQDRTPVSLPADADTPVVVLDYNSYCTKGKPPELVVRAGGTVTASSGCGDIKAEIHLSASEVQDLLNFVVRDQRFFDINPKEIPKDSEADTIQFIIDGAGTVDISVTTRDRERTIVLGSSGFRPWLDDSFPISPIEKRLISLMSLTMAGGAEAISSAVQAIEEFAPGSSELSGVSAADYTRTEYVGPGRVKTMYFRKISGAQTFKVAVAYGNDSKPNVTITWDQPVDDLLNYLESSARQKQQQTR